MERNLSAIIVMKNGLLCLDDQVAKVK